jgi:hypothetical protein
MDAASQNWGTTMALLGRQLIIHHAPVALAQSADAPGGTKTGDINLDNILKLIPADVVAIYVAAKGLQVAPIAGLAWPALLFWLCLLVCVVLRIMATRPANGGGVNWILVGVTALAFFVWAHAVSDVGPGPVIAQFYGAAAGVIATLLGLVAPKLVPAEPG